METRVLHDTAYGALQRTDSLRTGDLSFVNSVIQRSRRDRCPRREEEKAAVRIGGMTSIDTYDGSDEMAPWLISGIQCDILPKPAIRTSQGIVYHCWMIIQIRM